MPCPNQPFNGLHLRNPCKLHGSLLIYRPRRDGRLSWRQRGDTLAYQNWWILARKTKTEYLAKISRYLDENKIKSGAILTSPKSAKHLPKMRK